MSPTARSTRSITLFQAILDPGDEVIVATPCWVSYPEMVRMAGGTPVFVEMKKEHGFVPTNGEILAAITPRTKAFLLTSPNNPTGCVWNRGADGKRDADLAVEHDFFIVSDEIYEKLLYTGEKPCSIASLGEEAKAHTHGGERRQQVLRHDRVPHRLHRRPPGRYQGHDQLPEPGHLRAQQRRPARRCRGAQQADQACVETMRQAFQQRRDRIVERINAIPGLSCNKPDGAFYVMMDVAAPAGQKDRRSGDRHQQRFCRTPCWKSSTPWWCPASPSWRTVSAV